MPKPTFQDVIPPDKKSIKKIPIPERRSGGSSRPPRRPPMDESPHYYAEPQGGGSWRVFVVLVLALAFIGGAFYVMSQASGAQVSVTPKIESYSVDVHLTASKTPATESILQFQTITIAKDGKMTVPATGQENVSLKASGTIVIYNNYSDKPQALIANTRFETDKGLIFRISQPVTIPGKKNGVPGSVEAIVVADKPGPDYNVGLVDFSVPGFKGDPKYETVYARTKLSIQGGYIGPRNKVDKVEVDTARNKINGVLKNDLVRQASKDIPEGFVMPPNAYVITYESLPDTQAQAGTDINQRATLHGFIFKGEDLARKIAEKATGTRATNVDVADTSNLQFAFSTGTSTKVYEANDIAFNLKGSIDLVSVVDIQRLQTDLAGKPRTNLNAVLTAYPSIAKAEVVIRPFWKTSFPQNIDEIVINLNYSSNNKPASSTAN